MAATPTPFHRPNPDTEYEETKTGSPIIKPDGEGACCICNSGLSICLAEQGFTYNLTSAFAQTAAYVYT